MNLSLGFADTLFDCKLWRVSYIEQMTVDQSEAPGCVIGWTNFSQKYYRPVKEMVNDSFPG